LGYLHYCAPALKNNSYPVKRNSRLTKIIFLNTAVLYLVDVAKTIVYPKKNSTMKKLFLLLVTVALVLPLAAQKWAKNFDFVNECICGLSLVGKDKKYGYVDKAGSIIVPVEYNEGFTFNGGYAAVRKDSKWAYLDSTGKFITEFLYIDAQGFTEAMAPAKKESGWGFIDTLGKEVISFQYNNVRQFSERLSAVCANDKKQLWGFINHRGEVIIPFSYSFADSFNEEGKARVTDKAGNFMWINKVGDKVGE